jgi:hypothetical protein
MHGDIAVVLPMHKLGWHQNRSTSSIVRVTGPSQSSRAPVPCRLYSAQTCDRGVAATGGIRPNRATRAMFGSDRRRPPGRAVSASTMGYVPRDCRTRASQNGQVCRAKRRTQWLPAIGHRSRYRGRRMLETDKQNCRPEAPCSSSKESLEMSFILKSCSEP